MSKILIIDDEPSIRTTLAGILEDEGHKTVLCESGEEAITHFARDEFDLAILDLWLPGIDGLSVLERLKSGCREFKTEYRRVVTDEDYEKVVANFLIERARKKK